ncbi:hypothetical protein [Rhodococcus sp. ABRD24]|nr:hypothetical protein [Rhodococcus sp. ABRD24]
MDLSLTYSSDMINFGSVNLVGILASFLNALSLDPDPAPLPPV